jgi:hypothetical protein
MRIRCACTAVKWEGGKMWGGRDPNEGTTNIGCGKSAFLGEVHARMRVLDAGRGENGRRMMSEWIALFCSPLVWRSDYDCPFFSLFAGAYESFGFFKLKFACRCEREGAGRLVLVLVLTPITDLVCSYRAIQHDFAPFEAPEESERTPQKKG